MSATASLAPVTERFQAIADTVLHAEGLAVDPWLYRYCGPCGNPIGARRYVQYHADLLELARVDPAGAVVVDAGSGFGFTAILHALLGARQVRGVELHAGMVTSVEAYLPLLPEEVASAIEIVQGNVMAMPYPDASADVMLSIEAISHYLDVEGFLAEAFRVLRPGGVLIIADGNNGTNPIVRRHTHEIWEAIERGPRDQTVHGHVLGVPYAEIRRQLLDERFPELEDSVRAKLAERAAGFTAEQLIAAADEYVRTGALPNSVYRRGMLAVAPDGAVMERLFSPSGLADTLRHAGFTAKAYGYWGGANGKPAVRAVNRVLTALSAVTMPSAPSFRVIARKAGP
jgi:ubiquinone/menaquinone biosynthesis C-methylase UbiE